MHLACQIEFDDASGAETVRCGKPSIAQCADCGAAICIQCRTECCEESFCDYCYEYHVANYCLPKSAQRERPVHADQDAAA